jgi:enoyl-CoA hydratase
MAYDDYEFIEVTRDGGVLTVTLNRPERLNAVNPAMLEELGRVFHEVNRDSGVDAIILTGAGRAFCAGGDIDEMDKRNAGEQPHDWDVPRPGRHGILQGLLDLEPPIIAAVNGDAAGLGATLALFCDVVVAADVARFGDPHIRLGLVPGDGGTVIFSHLLGLPKAKMLLMTGDLIDAAEAERIGLISEVVPREDLIETALSIAGRIARNPRLAVRWTKLALNRRLKEEMLLGMEVGSALEWLSVNTEDHAEAVRAQREKRLPQYTGR